MLRGLPQYGSSPAIQTLTSYSTTKKGTALAQDVLFFNDNNSLKSSQKLPADGRDFAIVGINVFHNIRFSGGNTILQDQARLAYEHATRFRIEIGEELVVDVALSDLLGYDSIVNADGSVSREVKQISGLKLDPNQPRVIRPGLRTVLQITQPTMLTLDTGETVAIPGICAADEYYLKLNLDTDANSSNM
jgi:hypothetical protein